MFPYGVLSQERSEIRLVRFVDEPNATDDETPIRLEFHHASLDDSNTQYAALSYTWGERTNPIGVYIDGLLFEIRRNLHDALTQLRRSKITSWLWVDAICIQQANVEEKTWQVGQMRAIYSQAKVVYVWLGPGCDETDRTMDWISQMGPRALSSGALGLWELSRRSPDIHDYITSGYTSSHEQLSGNNSKDGKAPELARFIFDLLDERGLHSKTLRPEDGEDDLAAGIINLMGRDYWHRIWIFQEISLGTNAIVLCGSKAVSLDEFDATLSAVSYCITSGARDSHPDTRPFGNRLTANFYKSVALTTRRYHRQQDQNNRRIHLADIVCQHGPALDRPHYSATDPRDILFGLLGVISNDNRGGLDVDYSLSMEQVFSLLTKTLIRSGDECISQSHLDICVPRYETEKKSSLPTWVPDWREVGKYGLKVHPINYPPDFHATAGIRAPILPQDDPLKLLRRRGCRVDFITAVMTPPQWRSSNEWTASRIVDVKSWLDSILSFTELGFESGPGEDYIWRTVQRGRFHLRKKDYPRSSVPDDIAYIFRSIFRREHIDTDRLTQEQRECIRSGIYNLPFLRPDLTSLDDQLAYLRSVVPEISGSAARRRTLFKTNKSMLGLGHVAIREGDVVTLLAGVQSPIILRPLAVGGRGGFTFVGDAYVDGIMDGEFMKTMPAFEEFEIY